ncbi:MAG TPA: hypothetical protein VKY19_00075 [Ktedonosporobacter sp.]|jgi:uncharacterized Zn finger protein|nr:hypothetical protein [Ktedonosporobacter sp.]
MSVPTISEAAILRYASAETFRSGRTCYQQGAVIAPVLYGTTLLAEVREDTAGSVLVCCTFQADGSIDATCPCHNAWGGWCKHRVAACLVLLSHAKNVKERPALERMLEDFSRDELQTLIIKLTGQIPHLAEAIDQEAATRQPTALQSPSVAKTPAQAPQTKVDAKAIRREVRSTIHSLDRMRSSEAYWHVGAVVGEVEDIARRALEMLANGDGRGALASLEAVTDEYVDEWVNLDDSDGYAGELFRDLGKLWAEVLLSTDLSQDEREGWADMLTAWQREIGEYGVDDAFDLAIAAALSGWGDRLSRQIGITDEGEPVWDEDSFVDEEELAKIKLRILERQGRFHEYLALARAEGQTEAYLTMLVRLDRAQEAVAYGRTHLATPAEALALARALCEHGEREESLQIAEQGLALEGRKADLAIWLRDQAEVMGRQELALNAAEQAFRSQISLEHYRHAAKLAGEQWNTRKTVLLEYARTVQGYETQGKVDVFLHEGLIDDAIQAVEPYASHTIISQVVDVAIKERPEWTIQACKKQAEWIMDGGKSQYYQAAANWLTKARQAYRVLDRDEEWQSYFNELLKIHGRKYTLVPLLKAIK